LQSAALDWEHPKALHPAKAGLGCNTPAIEPTKAIDKKAVFIESTNPFC
jgi:hypothetical protein